MVRTEEVVAAKHIVLSNVTGDTREGAQQDAITVGRRLATLVGEDLGLLVPLFGLGSKVRQGYCCEPMSHTHTHTRRRYAVGGRKVDIPLLETDKDAALGLL